MHWKVCKQALHKHPSSFWFSSLKFAIAFLLLLLSTNSNPAYASKNGREQTDNKFTVGYTFLSEGTQYICSGSLIAPNIILTAGHCLLDNNGNQVKDIQLNLPGVALEAPVNPADQKLVVKTIVTYPGFKPTGSNEKNDVAFIVLEQPVLKLSPIPVATKEEIASLTENTEINGYGYGYVYETSRAYSNLPRQYSLSWKDAYPELDSLGDYRINSATSIGCVGDSGGPITAKLTDGREVVIGILSGILYPEGPVPCGSKGPNNLYYSKIALAHPYLNLVSSYKINPTPTPIPTPTSSQTPTPKPSPTKSITPTKKTITCIKGKIIKKVTAIKPVCPKGYKRKI